MFSKVFVYFTLFFSCLTITSQTLIVKSEDTKEAIPFVNVYSKDKSIGQTSNVKGEIDMSPFRSIDTIFISSINFKTLKTSYKILKQLNWVAHLKASSYEFTPIVISANKWQQEADNVPNLIHVLPQREIELINPQSAADMIGISNGVFVQKSQQGGGSPMIRGFSSNRLLYSVDGIRMNNAIFRSGNLHNVISLDPNSLETTEILFGPGSLIYGSDAIGGVMNFTTLKPQFSTDSFKLISGNYLIRTSSANGELTNHLDFNFANKKWSFLTSVTYSNYLSTVMGDHGPNEYLNDTFPITRNGQDYVAIAKNPKKQYPSSYNQLNLTQKVSYQLKDSLSLNYAFHFSETSDIPRYDRLIQRSNTYPRYAEWYYGPQKWVMNQISIVDQNKSLFYDKAIANMAIQQFVESRHSRKFKESIKNNNTERVNAYSLNLDFLKKINEKNTISYGLEGLLNKVKSDGNEEDITSGIKKESVSRYPESTWNSFALYLTNAYRFQEKINVVGGIRYNLFSLSSEFDTSLFSFPTTKSTLSKGSITGSLGLVYKHSKSFNLSGNFATGFRAPNVDDIGKVFDSEPGSVTVPNPDLNAEYAYNFEAGFSKAFKNVVHYSFTAFYTILGDAMVRRNYSLNGNDSIFYQGEMSQVQAIQNAANAYVYGFQSNIEFKINTTIKLQSEISYQKGEEELDSGEKSPSRHVAPWFGKTSLHYKKEQLSILLSTVYSGEISYENLNIGERTKPHLYAINNDGNPYSPSWYTVNLNFNYLLKDRFLLGGGIENITSQRYRTYSSGIAAPGRNYLLSLKIRY